MERINLPKHVRTLANLPVTDAPVISCYQSLAAGRLADRIAFDDHVQSLRRGLSIQEQDYFDVALGRIEEVLATELLPNAKGLAVFSARVSSRSSCRCSFRFRSQTGLPSTVRPTSIT